MSRKHGESRQVYDEIKHRVLGCHQQSGYGKGPKYRNQDSGKTTPPFFMCTPVKSLQHHDQNGKGCKHLVLREKTIRTYKPAAYVIERKLHSAHEYGKQVDTEKILFPVMGMGKALNDKEQKQGCGEPS